MFVYLQYAYVSLVHAISLLPMTKIMAPSEFQLTFSFVSSFFHGSEHLLS